LFKSSSMRLAILFLVAVLAGSPDSKAQTLYESKPSSASLAKGKGMVSFKLDGRSYKTDSTQTKCWTTSNVELAMLWAKGTNMNISWQIQNVKGKGIYRIDQDSKGSLNFTINDKKYWIRKTDGSNYLNIVITGIRDMYNIKLLSGTFEGVLEDKDGNKVSVKDGVFVTEGI